MRRNRDGMRAGAISALAIVALLLGALLFQGVRVNQQARTKA